MESGSPTCRPRNRAAVEDHRNKQIAAEYLKIEENTLSKTVHDVFDGWFKLRPRIVDKMTNIL
jgi:hypothetical protein